MNQLREKIKGIDYSIMTLISQRITLAREIGKIKGEQGLPIRNFQVERVVYDRISRYADDLDISSEFSTQLFRNIVEQSVLQQVTDQDNIPISDEKLHCLIIGGAGRMGRWFEHFLRSSGHHVSLVDPTLSTVTLDAHFSSLNRVKDLSIYDLIIVASPLRLMNEVLYSLVARKPRGIVFEISSIKSKVVNTIVDAENNGVKIMGIHPMFGPDTPHLNKKNIVMCTTSNTATEAINMFNDLFSATMANLVSVDLADHDRYMNLSLGLSHLVNLITGISLAKSEVSYDELMDFAGNTLRKQLLTTQDFFTKNTDLFHEIQHSNPWREKLFELVGKTLDELDNSTSLEKPEKFGKLMNEGNRFFDNV